MNKAEVWFGCLLHQYKRNVKRSRSRRAVNKDNYSGQSTQKCLFFAFYSQMVSFIKKYQRVDMQLSTKNLLKLSPTITFSET